MTRTVWARVKEGLKEARLPDTQVYIAERLHISQGSVTLWNKSGNFPTLENAISMAKLLNVNVEWLLTERGPKRPLPQDATAQRLWDIWPQLDDVTKGEIFGIASGRLRRGQEDVA
jgi:transcriptional regulator with XRE-family HTH domain